MGGLELLQALPLCRSAPHLLDCTWAKLGCAHVDANNSGEVSEADRPDFAAHKEASCSTENDWCAGADLDRTGGVDSLDEVFFNAALGCQR